MTFVRNILSDLVQKRLWPVAVALVVALVAVPVLLGRDSSSQTTTPTPENATGASTPKTSMAAVKVDADSSTAARNRGGDVRNPFKGPKTPTAQTATATPTSSSPSPTTQTSTGSTGSTGSTTPTHSAPTAPATSATTTTPVTKPTPVTAPATDPLAAYRVSLSFGRIAHVKTSDDVARLTPLPSTKHPVVLFLGVLSDGKTSVFLVGTETLATGDGACRLIANACKTIELKPGEAETFATKVGGTTVRYAIRVTSVERATAASHQAVVTAAERHSTSGAELLRDAHRRGDAALAGADGYRWLPDRGALVRVPTLISAKARAALPGQPVWHWKLGS